MTETLRRGRAELTLLVCMVAFTILSFFPAVPPSVPGKLKVAGAIVGLAWLGAIWFSSDRALIWRAHPWIAGAAIGLALWTIASAAWSVEPATALGAAGRMVIGVALMVIVYTAARDARAKRALIFAFVIGGVLTIAYGVIFKPGPPIKGIVFDPTRLYGGVGEPNDLGAVLLPCIALSLFTLPVMRSVVGRIILALLSVVLVVGLVLSQSRGALVAAAVMLIAGVLLAGRYRLRIAALVGVIVLVGVGYFAIFADDRVHKRLTSLVRADAYGGIADGSGRIQLWKAAIGLIEDHPIIGVGARNYRAMTGESLVVHNTYLEIQAELGLVGMILFMTVIIGTLVVAVRAVRASAAAGEVTNEFAARGAVVGLVGLLTAYLFISGEFQPPLWWLLGFALACGLPRSESLAPELVDGDVLSDDRSTLPNSESGVSTAN